tara:strand:+ start:861 stop:1199 length:339 start_codon:yes stop_codon:yes gene_type:complete
MDIGERDRIIMKLNEQLNVLSNYKMERTRELKEKVDDNKLLARVVDDYKAYDNKIADMKRQQSEQLEYLLLYLEKSMAEAGLTDTMLQKAQQEKKSLVNKLDNITKDLDSLL